MPDWEKVDQDAWALGSSGWFLSRENGEWVVTHIVESECTKIYSHVKLQCLVEFSKIAQGKTARSN